MSIFQNLSKLHQRFIDQTLTRMKVNTGLNSSDLRQMFFRMLTPGQTWRSHTLYEKRRPSLQGATCKDHGSTSHTD